MNASNIVMAICTVIITAVFADAQWTDISPKGVVGTDNDGTMGVTIVDIDADGDDDLVIANGGSGGGPTRLFLNDGSGNFTDETDGIFAEAHAVWSPLFGDMDNDGDPDLFFVAFGEQCRLFENQGDGMFVEVWGPWVDDGIKDDKGVPTGNMMARGGAWIDYDSDGLLDIMISTNAAANDIQSNKLYRNMGDNTFIDATPAIWDNGVIGRGVAWCDFDNDGDLDLYAVGGKGCPCNWEQIPDNWWGYAENRMYRNDNGVFTDVTNKVTRDVWHGRGVVTGDYDNDGDFDLYICNVGLEGWEGKNPDVIEGVNRLLRNDGNFQFVDVTPTALMLPGGERSCAWFDMDNDGDLDLVHSVMWNDTPNVGLFQNNNAGESFTWIFDDEFNDKAQTGKSGTGNAIADLDDDGDLDLLFGWKFGTNKLLQNDLDNDNHWIKIKLEGTTSNRSAIGARVDVVTGSLTQIREVVTGTGYWSQHSMVQHVGLGDRTSIDEIVVRWPSGNVQHVYPLCVDRTIRIVEMEPQPDCPADLNADCNVDVSDILMLIGNWGSTDPALDIDGSGEVDVADILLAVSGWGNCP